MRFYQSFENIAKIWRKKTIGLFVVALLITILCNSKDAVSCNLHGTFLYKTYHTTGTMNDWNFFDIKIDLILSDLYDNC